ncbi:MAG: SRPBCC family protein [Dehalococcoidia bacterium]
MPVLEAAIDIKAPPEKVFAYISDVENQPQWARWAKKVDVTSLTRKGLGATDEMVLQLMGKKYPTEGIISEYNENESMSRRLIRGFDLIEHYTLSAADGGTHVKHVIDYTPPFGGFGKVFNFLFMNRLFEQLHGDSVVSLKERVESAK